MKKYLSALSVIGLAVLALPQAAFAAEANPAALGGLPIGVGLTMGVAALGGTLGQGKAIASALDAIGRNPSASGKVFTPMLVGLAFVESLVIISFAIAYLLLGKAG